MRFRKVIIPLIVLGAMWLTACGGGSDGPLDEVGQRYTAYLVVLDNDNAVVQVDTIQDDCDGTPEEYSDTLAEVDITVSPDALGITLDRYTIEYIPLDVPLVGGQFRSPTLNNPIGGNAIFSVGPGESATLPEFTLISVSTKLEFNQDMGWLYFDAGLNDWVYDYPPAPDQPQEGRYTIRMKLYFEDTAGEERVIRVERTAWLKDYNNC